MPGSLSNAHLVSKPAGFPGSARSQQTCPITGDFYASTGNWSLARLDTFNSCEFILVYSETPTGYLRASLGKGQEVEAWNHHRGHDKIHSSGGIRLGGTSGQPYSLTKMSFPAQRGRKVLSTDLGDGIPDDRRQSVLVVTTATLAISTIFIAARLVSRLVIVRKVTWDDYFIVFGWVSFIGRHPVNPAQRDDILLLCLKFHANIHHIRFLLSD